MKILGFLLPTYENTPVRISEYYSYKKEETMDTKSMFSELFITVIVASETYFCLPRARNVRAGNSKKRPLIWGGMRSSRYFGHLG